VRLVRDSVLKNFLALAWAQFAGRIIRFLYLVLIARYLNQSDVGVFSYGVALYISLAAVGVFGQELFLSIRVARKPAMFSTVAAHSLAIVVPSLVAVTALGLIGLWLTEPDATHLPALLVLVMTVPVRGAVVWIRSCFIARERAAWIPRYEATFRGIELLLGMVALSAGAGLILICLLHWAVWFLEGAVAWRLLVRATGLPPIGKIASSLLIRYWKASAALMVSPWLLLIFPQIAVIGLRQVQQDMAQLAYLSVALQFFTTLLILPVSLMQAIVPGVVRAVRYRDDAGLMVMVTALKMTLIIGALLGAGSILAGPRVIAALFGPEYVVAGQAFAWLIWGLGPFSAAYMAISVLNSVGARMAAITAAGVMVAGMVVAMVWIGAHDSVDALSATVVGFLVASMLGMFASFLSLRKAVALGDEAWWLGATCLFGGCLVLGLLGIPSPLWASVGVAVLAVGGSLAFGVLSKEELSNALSRSGLLSGALVARK